jgi:hypothetical protein
MITALTLTDRQRVFLQTVSKFPRIQFGTTQVILDLLRAGLIEKWGDDQFRPTLNGLLILATKPPTRFQRILRLIVNPFFWRIREMGINVRFF